MHQPPCWLTSRGINELEGESLSQYNDVREEFMEAFENEERSICKNDKDGTGLSLMRTVKQTWETGSFFYLYAVESTTGLFDVYQQHIQSRYTKKEMTNNETNQALSFFWTPEREKVIADKLSDLREYTTQLRRLFELYAEKETIAEEETAEESLQERNNAEVGDMEGKDRSRM